MPGLGRFYALPQKAVLSSTQATILPPQIQYFFEDNNSDDSDFIVFVSEMLHTNFAKAEKKVGRFTQDVFNRLLNYQRATIPYIGELIQSSDASIEYKPDQELLKLETAYLPELQIEPVSRIEIKKETIIKEAISANKVYQSEFKASGAATATLVPEPKDAVLGRTWTDYLLSIFLILILILGMRSCFKLYNENQLRNTTFTTKALDDSPETNHTAIVDTNGVVGGSYNAGGTISETNNIEDIASVEAENSTIEVKDLVDSNSIQVYANGTTDEIINNGCIIIVGVYSKYSNIGNMTSQIEKKGLESYSEQNNNGLTRVGFRFDCNKESDLDTYLRSVRLEFGTNAWYLSPNIEVY